MQQLRGIAIFVLQSIIVGLAAAFIVVYLRPDLLGGANGPRTPEGNTGMAVGPASYADAVTRTAPAVVNIHSAKRITQQGLPFLDDPVLRRFFGDQFTPRQELETTLGSGVIVNPDGFILTNNHVIAGADEILVALSDGRVAQARIVGTDPETDVAGLQVDLSDLPAVIMGVSDQLKVGDVVLAIGNPFGFGQTVTQGIVSATGRSQLGLSTFENFIQTDAAINPGNSGGALINARGELVGINTAIFSRGGGVNGIGFAVPVNLARGVMNQLLENGRVIRGWLGVDPQDLTPELAEAFGLENTNGVIVRNVFRNSPAETAGIRRGDTITHINGEPVMNTRDALNRIARMIPGERLELRLIRAGDTFNAEAVVGERAIPQQG